MHFNSHSNLIGRHAFLSASKYHWINYTDEKLDRFFDNFLKAADGTRRHAFAAEAIRLGIKLPGNGKTINKYVNDAIGYGMTPEQILYYSDNAFGTPDAISFRKGKLRIHDLKTGEAMTSEKQLIVYAAFFCLEYKFNPFEIEIELRIYQSDEVRIYDPDPDVVMHVMETIKRFDKRIEERKKEVL